MRGLNALADHLPLLLSATLPASLYADPETRVAIWCLFGGALGGYVSIWFTPAALLTAAREQPKPWIVQITVPMIAALLFAPAVVWHMDSIPERFYACVAVGGAFGVISWSAIAFWKAWGWRMAVDRAKHEFRGGSDENL